MPKPGNPVLMAVIGAAHGIRGELRVKTFTGDPLALGDYGPLHDKAGREFEIADIRPAKTVVVVRFKGVASREAAEALNGTELFVDRAVLPRPDDDEFYHADLVGLAVRDESGADIGRVTSIQNFGGGDILEVALAGVREALVPFSAAAVPEIDLDGGFLRIDSVAAGLSGDEDGEAAGGKRGFSAGRRPRGPADAGGNR